ncbi:MAG: OmpH family outer membrane protein [Bacteroidota bacterium]
MKRILLVSAVSLFALSFASAQTHKFGHINSAELIQSMPQTRQADSTLKKFGESLDGQLKVMTAEYQAKIQNYKAAMDTLPDAIKATKEQELQDLGNRIEGFRDNAQESIQKKKEELYGPVLKRAEDAIKEVAKEKAYSYIFDTSSGSFLYAQESDDIMSLVKTKLGVK